MKPPKVSRRTLSIPELLKALKLEPYVSTFVDDNIDAKRLRRLTSEDLAGLGMPAGPRERLLHALATLKRNADPVSAHAKTSRRRAVATTGGSGERRQLTVLFCDIVGYSTLAQQFDPEILQTIVKCFAKICFDAVKHFEGKVAERKGDGILAYFGSPLAHEDDAHRAVRTGLKIIESLSKEEMVGVGHLAVRIGIARGLVVVDARRKATGEPMIIAERLQTIAEPDSVVISGSVHCSTGGTFEYEDLKYLALKGIQSPTHVWRVCGLGKSVVSIRSAYAPNDCASTVRRRLIDLRFAIWIRVTITNHQPCGDQRLTSRPRRSPVASSPFGP